MFLAVGTPFIQRVEANCCDFETPKGISLELLRDYWQEVGIDLRLRDNAPHPVAVSRRLKNAVPNGIWGADNRWTTPYHPATWDIEETDDEP